MRLKIYISGPISKGNRSSHLFQSLEAQEYLLKNGYAPLNPMLTMLHPNEASIPHNVWMEADYPWVECADAILRLPGESIGADAETRHAQAFNIPVFYSIKELDKWKKTQQDEINMNPELSSTTVSY